MIVLKATQDKVLSVLQSVAGIVERRHTLPILANVLIARALEPPLPLTDTATYVPQTPPMETHWGLTLNALPWAIFALMQLWRARQASPLQTLRRALAGLGGVIAAAGLASAATLGNPLFGWTADDLGARVKGPLVLDTLALAYAVPGLLLLVSNPL